jgi:hypothetical protein
LESKAIIVPLERIQSRICFIRGEKVMLDADLAALYGVETKALNQAVKRNIERFPDDFMFQLTVEEAAALRFHLGTLDASGDEPLRYQSGTSNDDVQGLRSQSVTSNGRGGRRSLPYAFTEQGVAMLSTVLHSDRAVRVNIEIMRAFVRLRQMLATNADLARKLMNLEKKYDAQFKVVFDAIRELMTPPEPKKKRRIGFGREGET